MNRICTTSVEFPGRKLKGKDRYKRLYHYTSFDTFVKIWLTKRLKFGVVSEVNDIQEADQNVDVDIVPQVPLIHCYIDIKKSYKQISLTMDYDSYIRGCMSTMMWGTYGDKRKGVCIELNYDRLCLPKGTLAGIVNYKSILDHSAKLPIDIKTKKEVENFIIKNKKDIFFTKQKNWSGENEYRILSKSIEFLDISNAISAVYLTSCNSIECDLVEKLVNEMVPVQFLKFRSSQNKAIPVLVDTKRCREQNEHAKNNPDNALNHISSQAKEHYQRLQEDENASLLKADYVFPIHDN